MARPFSLRDLALVHRLSEKGAVLHAETALTKQWQPLWGALQSLFSSGEELTCVWRAGKGEGAGFVQLHLSEVNSNAHLIYIGTTPAETHREAYSDGLPLAKATGTLNEGLWLALLDGVVSHLGQRGIHSLIAEADENGPELILLRRAGFAVYTRQDIWVVDRPVTAEQEQTLLTPYHPQDDWEMALLYSHIVPPLIQMVEPAPPDEGVTWVLREDVNELSAFVHIHEGSGASWLRVFIHPNAQVQAQDIVAAALQIAQPRPDHPVYCCVRRYQSWLHSALEANGFTLWGSQAVMVKHTVHPVRKSQPELPTVLQAQGVTTPPAPILHVPDRPLLRKIRPKKKLNGSGVR